MKILPTHSARLIIRQAVARSSHPLTQIHKAVLPTLDRHLALTPIAQQHEDEQTRSSRHPPDRQPVHRQVQIPSRTRQMAIGNLHQHLVDRPARWKNSTLIPPTVEVGPTAPSVQQMFWKFSTILLGAKAYAGVSHKEGGVRWCIRHNDCTRTRCAQWHGLPN